MTTERNNSTDHHAYCDPNAEFRRRVAELIQTRHMTLPNAARAAARADPDLHRNCIAMGMTFIRPDVSTWTPR